MAAISLSGCNGSGLNAEFRRRTAEERYAIMDEFRLSFNFFWEEANTIAGSSGFGLIPDRWTRLGGRSNNSSIAATGFGLATIAAGAHEGFVTWEEAEERVYGTLRTLEALQINGHSAYEGMFIHFMDIQTGRRSPGWNDISTIDTALLIAGALTAGEFFGGRARETANLIYSRVNWAHFANTHHPTAAWRGRQFISMGFRPDPSYGGIRPAPGVNFHPTRPGLLFNWDWFGEQVILYVLAAGAPNPEFRVGSEPFYQMNRPVGRWLRGPEFIFSFHNSIFVHQFTHAFVDFRGIVDREGVDWFQNSVDASMTSWQWSVDNRERNASFSDVSWGLSASDTGIPGVGYCGSLGTPPRGWGPTTEAQRIAYEYREGTINTQGALGSIIFTPDQSIGALMNYRSKERLQGHYGIMGAFDLQRNWFSNAVIGIDKGIIAMMFSNFRDDFVQRHFMQSDAARYGLERLEFSRV